MLTGTEVKSLRDGQGACSRTATRPSRTARCGCTTSTSRPTRQATRENHEPERPRKLLMHRREIERLIGKTKEKGLTLVADAALLQGPPRQGRDRARARQGRQDKRHSIKEREMKREMERSFRR